MHREFPHVKQMLENIDVSISYPAAEQQQPESVSKFEYETCQLGAAPNMTSRAEGAIDWRRPNAFRH